MPTFSVILYLLHNYTTIPQKVKGVIFRLTHGFVRGIVRGVMKKIKYVIITGCSAGISYETAKYLKENK